MKAFIIIRGQEPSKNVSEQQKNKAREQKWYNKYDTDKQKKIHGAEKIES